MSRSVIEDQDTTKRIINRTRTSWLKWKEAGKTHCDQHMFEVLLDPVMLNGLECGALTKP